MSPRTLCIFGYRLQCLFPMRFLAFFPSTPRLVRMLLDDQQFASRVVGNLLFLAIRSRPPDASPSRRRNHARAEMSRPFDNQNAHYNSTIKAHRSYPFPVHSEWRCFSAFVNDAPIGYITPETGLLCLAQFSCLKRASYKPFPQSNLEPERSTLDSGIGITFRLQYPREEDILKDFGGRQTTPPSGLLLGDSPLISLISSEFLQNRLNCLIPSNISPIQS